MKTQPLDDIEFVIWALTRYNSVNDIIMALCEHRGFQWEEAANFVSRVQREHTRSIHARQ